MHVKFNCITVNFDKTQHCIYVTEVDVKVNGATSELWGFEGSVLLSVVFPGYQTTFFSSRFNKITLISRKFSTVILFGEN